MRKSALLLLGGIALAFLLLGPIAGAASRELGGVTVEYVAPTLTLRVMQATDLRTVLHALCQHTEAECMINTPNADETMVFPVTLRGNWNEVVDKLARSFNLNYAAVAPTPGHPGMLVVLSSAPASGDEVMVKGNRDSFESMQDGPRSAAGDLTPASSELTEQISRQRGDSEPLNANNLLPALPSQAFGGPVGDEQAPKLSRGEEATPNPDQLQASERSFRAMYGGDLLAKQPLGSSPSSVVLPHSDANGNPITVSVTNEPVTILPWPGPNGLPVIISPGTYGLKLDPPIPPSNPAL